MTVRENLDIEKLEDFRSFLKDNPEKVRLGLEAKAVHGFHHWFEKFCGIMDAHATSHHNDRGHD